MVDTYIAHLSKPIEYTPPRVNPSENYGLWVIINQCRFMDFNKCKIVVQSVDTGESCTGTGLGGNMENLCFLFKVAVNTKPL